MIEMAAAVPERGNHEPFAANEVGDVVGKAGKIHASIAAQPLSLKKWQANNRSANIFDFREKQKRVGPCIRAESPPATEGN